MVAELTERNKRCCFTKKKKKPCALYIYIPLLHLRLRLTVTKKKNTMKCTAIFRTPTATFLSRHSFSKVLQITAQPNSSHALYNHNQYKMDKHLQFFTDHSSDNSDHVN
jgi:hypothetical protein